MFTGNPSGLALPTGNPTVLILPVTASVLPDTETAHTSAEANILSQLQSDEVLHSLAQTLSEGSEAYIKLNGMSREYQLNFLPCF